MSNRTLKEQKDIIRTAHRTLCIDVQDWRLDWDDWENHKGYSYKRPTSSHKRITRSIEDLEYRAIKLLEICQKARSMTNRATEA